MSTPFIINLERHPEGYVFHSIEDTSQQNKAKKAKPSQPKSTLPKTTNRLIKQIGLISDIPPIIVEQSQMPKEVPSNLQQIARHELEVQQEQEDIDIELKRDLPIPNSHVAWFSTRQIHEIERQQFEEFFTGKTYKTPELYQCYRNFMIEAYQRNPKRYLTFVACRRVLRGDVNSLLKIYNFLNKEGIINYCIFYEGNYTFKQLSHDKSFEMSTKPQSCIKRMPEKSETDSGGEIDTDNLTVTVINKNFSRTFRVYCSKCRLICGIVWYISLQDEDRQKNLCFDCYNTLDREQAASFTKVDILKKMQGSNGVKPISKTTWGLDDNIKLLDFMSSCHGQSWNDLINQFDNKKTLEDIIIQFMQFPITNYDPNQYTRKIKHEQIGYKDNQHINMLEQLYSKSEYYREQVVKKEEDIQQSKESSKSKMANFRKFTQLILGKYSSKLNQLHKIENIIEETNLNINQQVLCNRVRIARDVPTERMPYDEDEQEILEQ